MEVVHETNERTKKHSEQRHCEGVHEVIIEYYAEILLRTKTFWSRFHDVVVVFLL